MKKEVTASIELYDSVKNEKITREVTFFLSSYLKTPEQIAFFEKQTEGHYYSKDNQFAARIGRGKKLHSTNGSIIYFKDAERAKKLGWLNFGRKPLFTDEDGVMYFFERTQSIRNSEAQIETWADLYIDSPIATQQEYYGSIKAGA